MFLTRPAWWLLLLLLSAACDTTDFLVQHSLRQLPSQRPNAPVTSPRRLRFRVVGSLSEALSPSGPAPAPYRPLVGANVNAWVDTDPLLGYSYMWANGAQLSDDGGRFALGGLPDSARVMVEHHYKSGYVQQCAAPPLVMDADATVDIELIPRSLVSVSPEEVRSGPGFRSISGVMYKTRPRAASFRRCVR